jgi:hypothetical protein
MAPPEVKVNMLVPPKTMAFVQTSKPDVLIEHPAPLASAPQGAAAEPDAVVICSSRPVPVFDAVSVIVTRLTPDPVAAPNVHVEVFPAIASAWFPVGLAMLFHRYVVCVDSAVQVRTPTAVTAVTVDPAEHALGTTVLLTVPEGFFPERMWLVESCQMYPNPEGGEPDGAVISVMTLGPESTATLSYAIAVALVACKM